MFVGKSELSLLINKGLITDFDNFEKQITANGFDVRACAFVEILDGGKLAINKCDNVPPKLGTAFVLPGYEDRLQGYDITNTVVTSDFVGLKKNQPYFVITCEKVNTPNNMMAHATHRTSVFRFAQCIMGFGFTEAGYKGFWTFILTPLMNSQIQLGSRIAQVSFSYLTSEEDYAKQKEFNYQGGKLF